MDVEGDFAEGLGEVGVKVGAAAVGDERAAPTVAEFEKVVGVGGGGGSGGRSFGEASGRIFGVVGAAVEVRKDEEFAGFVVGEHERVEGGESVAAELARRLEDRVMFEGGGENLVASESTDDGVVALGGARGEDDLRGIAVDELGEQFAGLFDGGVGGVAGGVESRGVGEEAALGVGDGVDDLGKHGSRGSVVEVNHSQQPSGYFRLGF